MARKLPTMAHVWLEIAWRIRYRLDYGPFICNIAERLLSEGQITVGQLASVMDAVKEERQRQGGGFALWSGIRGYSQQERVVRIQFCTEQIRRIGRKAARA